MTQEQYDKSIATGELQLSAWGKFSYFALVGLLFFMMVMPLLFFMFDNSTNFSNPPLWPFIIPGILGVLLYRFQKKQLKFEIINTTQKKAEVLKLIKQVGTELEWDIVFEESDMIEPKTDYGFFSGKTPQQITILFNYSTVLISCIYDLDRKSGIDITGRNKRTIGIFVDRISKAENHETQ